ncbi:MAG: hypothetical protein A3G93_06405 [Nitrospinae bacterium RIFCSPLOWO2_12_FULL_45_22]|nr:MAG: hypothetical protein A3G93_06405 [Nitrospinae bacterium RIFCSPLOWO2_12_FULL_45_22]
MSRINIERLLRQPEGQFLERKSCYGYIEGKWKLRKAKDVAKDVAETLSAFANADGGTLLLGVDDDGNVSGVDFPDDKIRIILDAPKNLIAPPLGVKIDKAAFPGKWVFIFSTHWMPDAYQLSDGRYLLRIGDSNTPFPANQIELLKMGKRKAIFDSRIELTALWNDLSAELISDFAKKVAINGSHEDILSQYRLIDYDNGNPRFNLAALLLFGKDPLRWHPRCGIDFIKYEGTERKTGRALNIVKRVRLELPLVRLIEEAYKAISAHIKERQYLHDLFFVEKIEYPSFAWQEAIVNAVAHRDYSIQGLSIEVWMFDDRIEIRSPGLPPEPVTLEKILERERVHASRNPLIVRILTDLGYMRETGEGIPRMFEEMEKNGLYPPKIEIVADSLFSVTLKNQPMYSLEDIEWLEQFNYLKLNPNQKRMLLFARSHGGSFTSRNWQKICKVDIYTAAREIKEMMKKRVARLLRKGGRVYKIEMPSEKQMKDLSEEYRALEPILVKKGYLKNEDIRATLHVPRYTALRIAQRLVDLGLLIKTGTGKGMKYTKLIN